MDWAKEKLQIAVDVVRKLENQVGFVVAARRWVVERTFAWLLKCRRLVRDYEELVETVEAWIYVAMSRLYFTDDLRDKESAKIRCGDAHFQALAVRENPARYVVATKVDDIL